MLRIRIQKRRVSGSTVLQIFLPLVCPLLLIASLGEIDDLTRGQQGCSAADPDPETPGVQHNGFANFSTACPPINATCWIRLKTILHVGSLQCNGYGRDPDSYPNLKILLPIMDPQKGRNYLLKA